MLIRASNGSGGSGGRGLDKNHYFWNYSEEPIQFEDSVSLAIGANGCLVFDIRERNYVTVTLASAQRIATKGSAFVNLGSGAKTDISAYDWLTVFRATTSAQCTVTFSDT